MAKAHETTQHPMREPVARHHGQGVLAEVVPIRPGTPPGGFGHTLFRIVQVFASLRAQAAPVESPPTPPSSPAPLRPGRPGRPGRPVAPDAA
jgi:hypothetical protein